MSENVVRYEAPAGEVTSLVQLAIGRAMAWPRPSASRGTAPTAPAAGSTR